MVFFEDPEGRARPLYPRIIYHTPTGTLGLGLMEEFSTLTQLGLPLNGKQGGAASSIGPGSPQWAVTGIVIRGRSPNLIDAIIICHGSKKGRLTTVIFIRNTARPGIAPSSVPRDLDD